MLVNTTSPPHKSLYFLGALMIQVLSEQARLELETGYFRLNALLEGKSISFSYYLLTLDWLFVLGLIEVTETGDVVKCF